MVPFLNYNCFVTFILLVYFHLLNADLRKTENNSCSKGLKLTPQYATIFWGGNNEKVPRFLPSACFDH